MPRFTAATIARQREEWLKRGRYRIDEHSTIEGQVARYDDALEGASPLSRDSLRRIDEILSSDNPAAIWQLADLDEMVWVGAGHKKLSKALLLDTNWDGVLNFNDNLAMHRFYKYTGQNELAQLALEGISGDTDSALAAIKAFRATAQEEVEEYVSEWAKEKLKEEAKRRALEAFEGRGDSEEGDQ